MNDTDFVRHLREEWVQRPVRISTLRGGISNKNYLVEDQDKLYKVRIPGRNTEFFSDRDGEISDLRALEPSGLIWEANSNPTGVIPGVIDYKEDSKISIFSFVPGITAENEDFSNPEVRVNAIASVKRIHECGVELRRVFNVFMEIDRYAKRLRSLRVHKMNHYPTEKFLTLAQLLRDELERDQVPLVPCHNDLLSENFILSDGIVHIIDWELGGMNDPRFEIANFLIEHENIFTETDENHILELYFGDGKKVAQRAIDYYKFLADFFWALWAMIQQNVSELDFDFEKYACDRFEASLRHVDILRRRYSIPFL